MVGRDITMMIKKYILETVKSRLWNSDNFITVPQLITLVHNRFRSDITRLNAKNMVYNIMKDFNVNKGLRRERKAGSLTYLWYKDINFDDVYKSKYAKIIGEKLHNKITITEEILQSCIEVIRSFSEDSFTMSVICDYCNGHNSMISTLIFRSCISNNLVELGLLEKDTESTDRLIYRKTKKFFTFFPNSIDPLDDYNFNDVVDYIRDEKSFKTFNSNDLNNLPIDKRLELLKLTPEDIGVIIIDLLGKKKEEDESDELDNRTITELQGYITDLKIENSELLTNERRAKCEIIDLRSVLKKEKEEKEKAEKVINELKTNKENVRGLNEKISILTQAVNDLSIENNELKTKKGRGISLDNFADLSKYKDQYKDS